MKYATRIFGAIGVVALVVIAAILMKWELERQSNKRALEAQAAQAKVSARRKLSASHLRLIGQTLILYYNETHAIPKSLEELRTRGDLSASDCESPSGGRYVYLGWSGPYRKPSEIVVKEEGLSDGGNCLFGDGHVEWIDAETVTQRP
jgi:prepilin-type processing-associated H-X9-DG protein